MTSVNRGFSFEIGVMIQMGEILGTGKDMRKEVNARNAEKMLILFSVPGFRNLFIWHPPVTPVILTGTPGSTFQSQRYHFKQEQHFCLGNYGW
ncbi:hypothetical protein STEG23_003995 [Scotinomys teguina]